MRRSFDQNNCWHDSVIHNELEIQHQIKSLRDSNVYDERKMQKNKPRANVSVAIYWQSSEAFN